MRGPVVGEEYGNARTAWQRMSSPPSPRPHETDVLHAAAEPGRRHPRLPAEGDRTEPDLTPARHEVTPVEVSPSAHETPPRSDEHRLLGREPHLSTPVTCRWAALRVGEGGPPGIPVTVPWACEHRLPGEEPR
ncbi:hypothetical protein ABZ307_27210 [Streptomyces griseorubiginosus]|uniref:hypothetical protein n=1 Tax=Streptomyces griseorubiginosus TaxID=67304 RepID=UPI0033A8FCD4